MKCPLKLKHASDPDSRFLKSQLRMGIKEELEHTSNRACAKAISKAHLAEDAHYYSKLKRLMK
jgi:hypothetical protein